MFERTPFEFRGAHSKARNFRAPAVVPRASDSILSIAVRNTRKRTVLGFASTV